MNGAMWWIDRWRKSTAYTDLTLAEQGAYRNLLDELWLRDGVLPDDDRVLGRICGDALEWPKIRDRVMARFTKIEAGWIHPTQGEIMAACKSRQDSLSTRGRKAADARWHTPSIASCNAQAHAQAMPSVSVSGSVSGSGSVSEKNQTCRQEPTAPGEEKSESGKSGPDLPPFALAWNRIVDGSPLPRVTKWTTARGRALKARLAEEPDLAVWERAMELLRDSPHHRGENDRGWVANVDFLLQAGQGVKWVEKARAPVAETVDPGLANILRGMRAMGGGS